MTIAMTGMGRVWSCVVSVGLVVLVLSGARADAQSADEYTFMNDQGLWGSVIGQDLAGCFVELDGRMNGRWAERADADGSVYSQLLPYDPIIGRWEIDRNSICYHWSYQSPTEPLDCWRVAKTREGLVWWRESEQRVAAVSPCPESGVS